MPFRPLALLLLALLTGEATACLGPHTPDVYEPSEFARIFLGQVTGVHLTAYEAYRLDQLHPEHVEPSDDPLDDFYPISSTPTFEVNAIVLETYRGRPQKSGAFSLGGCQVEIPALKSRALFFVTREGDTVTVPESSDTFEYWLEFAKSRAGATRSSSKRDGR